MPTTQIPLHLAWLFPSWGSWRSARVNCQLCRVVDSCHVNVLWSQVRWLSLEQLILTLLSLSGWRDSQRQSLGGEWWSHGAMEPWSSPGDCCEAMRRDTSTCADGACGSWGKRDRVSQPRHQPCQVSSAPPQICPWLVDLHALRA